MKNTLFLLALSATVLACSSNDDSSDDDSETIGASGTRSTSLVRAVELTEVPERVGYISISDVAQFGDVSTLGAFVTWPNDAGTDVSRLFGSDANTIGDNCTVAAVDPVNDETFSDYLQDNFELIAAGDNLTLTSSAGTYGSLEKQELRAGVGYFSTTELPYPSPSKLTISIPGDEFGAMSVITEKPEPIEEFSLALDSELLENVTLTWKASSQNETLLAVELIDSNNNTPQFVGSCLLVDDGNFIVPTSLHRDAESIAGENIFMTITDVSRIRVGSVEAESSSDVIIHVRSVGLSE